MFGNLEKKLKAHAVTELIDKLAQHSATHVDGIGTFRLADNTIRYIPDERLVHAVYAQREAVGTQS